MANKLISEIPLPKSIANVFAARNISTAKDALSLTEFELMELLDVGLNDVRSALSQISEIVAPPYQTVIKILYKLLEIGLRSFPEIFRMKEMAQEMAGRILVLRPTSLSEFTQSLQQIKVSLLQNQVKMLVIDSMAALVSGEPEQGARRQQTLSWHISFIKSLAELSRIPVVVTNQVRSQNHNEASQYSFQVQSRDGAIETPSRYDSHLVAALGIHWAHAVTTRLVLEAKSAGQRFIKVAKSPISPPLAFPFHITSSGISLLSDEGMELMGPEINSIHCQGLFPMLAFSESADYSRVYY
ncbi:hypothetical protein REPUB_Repub11eG0175700 [Reevesia pubescens]